MWLKNPPGEQELALRQKDLKKNIYIACNVWPGLPQRGELYISSHSLRQQQMEQEIQREN